jgi:hypothetical protein
MTDNTFAPEVANRLIDLAARIKTEHEAASATLTQGLQHAIVAGQLLLKAKKQLPHGEWLPWLSANCSVSERTAQAYMRVARGFADLGDDKSATVADLSFRDALNMLAVVGSAAESMSSENFERASELAGDVGWRRAISNVRIADRRSRYTLETPRAMLPSPTGRKIRVARNQTERKWKLVVGPDVSRETLQQREQAVREDDPVRTLQQRHDRLLERAAELEAEAKRFRDDAEAARRKIKDAIRDSIGPVAPFTETYDFQCDETTDAELAVLSQDQLVDRLLAARGAATGAVVEVDRGYWGDMTFIGLQPIEPGPGAWTKMGSPEWLAELFPDWNEETPGAVAIDDGPGPGQ